MPICVSLNSPTLQDVQADFAQAIALGADWVEVRLDCLQRDQLERLGGLQPWITAQGARLILTCRPPAEGGHYEGSDHDRIETLLRAASYGAARVDVEAACYGSIATVRAQVDAWVAGSNAGWSSVILSAHYLDGRPPALSRRFLDLCATPAGIVKLTWRARDARDNFEALDLLRCQARPCTVFCLGHDGLPSRVLGRKFGSALTYCALRPGNEVAPGQPALTDLQQTYRWAGIDEHTAVYGVLGDPVRSSLSPHVHNAAFAHGGISSVYVPFRLEADGHLFADFMTQLVDRPWLGVRGLSITAPHKRNAWLLTEGGLDPLPRRIGAVNTLTFAEGGLAGDNTDFQAVLNWLARGLQCELPDLAMRRFDVLGAGGLARSAVAALRMLGAEVTIHNRTLASAQALAAEFGGNAAALGDDSRMEGDVLVQCTSLGMHDQPELSPLRPEQIRAGSTVFEAIYNPRQTRLLQDAQTRGCRTVDGLELFLDQAALQFAIWTHQAAPREVMRSAALARLTG